MVVTISARVVKNWAIKSQGSKVQGFLDNSVRSKVISAP